MNLDLYNKKMYGSNTPITFNGKTYEPGDPNYELVLKMTQAHFREDLNKRDKLRQMIIKLEDQAFYETNQGKTDVIFVSQNTPQSSMGGKSFILPLGTGMGGVSALNSKRSSEFENRMYTT